MNMQLSSLEWAWKRLGKYPLPPCVWQIKIRGDGDAARNIAISRGAVTKELTAKCLDRSTALRI